MIKSNPVVPGIIIYDDQCRFCTRFARWCEKKQQSLTIMPVREAGASALLRRPGIQFRDLQTIYFIEGDAVYTRSRAVFRILGFTGYPWKLVSLLRHLPVRLTDYFYKLFARYRYRI